MYGPASPDRDGRCNCTETSDFHFGPLVQAPAGLAASDTMRNGMAGALAARLKIDRPGPDDADPDRVDCVQTDWEWW